MLGATTGGDPVGETCPDHWVASWGASPSNGVRSFREQTIRVIVTPHLAGGTVRIGISNRFGTGPIVLRNVRIATAGKGAATQPGTDTSVTFAGSPILAVPPGADAVSDPVSFPVEPSRNVAISAYVRRRADSVTQHATAIQTSYLTDRGSGDRAAQIGARGFDQRTRHWFLVDRLDVLAPAATGAVVAFGDSITDGVMSPNNQNQRYPDFLNRRLTDAGIPLSTVNSGIAGNAVTVGSEPRQPTGPSALDRLDDDVLSVPGVEAAIVQEGLNRLAEVGPDAVIGGLTQIVERLHYAGLDVVLATLPPARGSTALGDVDQVDAYRQQVNDWIRSQELAPVADFDSVLEDPARPGYIASEYASLDGLHPNAAGYAALADAVPIDALTTPTCP